METREQLEILKESSCDYIQGYYFSKPMPADDLTMMLSREKRRLGPLRAVTRLYTKSALSVSSAEGQG